MRNKIKKHIQKYYSECRNIQQEYRAFEEKDAKSFYAGEFLNSKKNEKISRLKDIRLNLRRSIEDEFLAFSNNIKADEDVIKSLEYQTRLSNLINLLNMNSELSENYFDFMVEANDFQTIELLKDKYKSKVLSKVHSKVDKEKIIANARVELSLLNNYIDNDRNYTMEESILNVL